MDERHFIFRWREDRQAENDQPGDGNDDTDNRDNPDRQNGQFQSEEGKRVSNAARASHLTILLPVERVSTFIASTAANTVPPSGLSDTSVQVPASELAPPECDSIRNSLQTVVVCTGEYCTGSNANGLILGTTGDDTIDGKNGDDCIVGGGGDDTLSGDNGNDILVGGPGYDTLDGGMRPKDTDICIDEADSTVFLDCEIIQ